MMIKRFAALAFAVAWLLSASAAFAAPKEKVKINIPPTAVEARGFDINSSGHKELVMKALRKAKAKEEVKQEIGVWNGGVRINGIKDGHSCIALPSLTGDPAEYEAEPDEGSVNFTAALENQDLDFCISGTPCDEHDPYSVSPLSPWYLYQWEDATTRTEPTPENSYTMSYSAPRGSGGIFFRNLGVHVYDVHGQHGDICEHMATDATKYGGHVLVLYRPVETPPLSHPPYSSKWVHEVLMYEPGLRLVRYSFIESWFEWLNVAAATQGNFPNYTSCNCYHSAVIFSQASGLKITNNATFTFAPPALAKMGLGFKYSFNVDSIKNFESGVILNCETPYLNTTFTVMQEKFRVKETVYTWFCDYPGPYLGGYELCIDPAYYLENSPIPTSGDWDGGSDTLYIRKTRSCCN